MCKPKPSNNRDLKKRSNSKGEVGLVALLPLFSMKGGSFMGKIDWDVVTNFTDAVTTTLKTVTFPKVQEQVYLRNQGNANFTYTIGSQSGTLTPGQSVTVNQDVSSFTLQAVSGTHTFELRAKEKGTEIEEAPSDVPSQIASLTSALVQRAQDSILSEQERIIKEVLTSKVDNKLSTRDVVYYQAEIKNPIGVTYTNAPIALKVKFDVGECVSDKRIIVKDQSGNSVPFQWEGEKHPHYLLKDTTNLATYSDGSLNCGTIWIMGNLGATETAIFTIEIHSVDVNNGFTDNIPLVVNTSNPAAPKDELTGGISKYQFDYSTGNYHLRRIFQNGIEVASAGGPAFYPFIQNASNVDVNTVLADATAWTSTKSVNGNGVVFKEYVVVNTYNAKTDVTITTVYRIYANGHLSIDCRFLTTLGTTDRTIQGFGIKFKPKTIAEDYLTNTTDRLAKAFSTTEGFYYKIVNGHMNKDVIDITQTYNTQLSIAYLAAAGEKNFHFFWNSGADKHLNPNSFFYIKARFVPFTSSNDVTIFDNQVSNPLSAHATKYTKKQLIKRYYGLVKTFADQMHGYSLGTAFPGLNAFESFAYNKLNDVIREQENIQPIIDYIGAIQTTYQNGTAIGFQNIYLGGRGVEFIGRDTAPLRFFREQCPLINKNTSYVTLTTITHNLADFYVWLEGYSGGNGAIKLKYNTEDNMNAEATAMKALNNSLKIVEDATRRATYNRIKARLEGFVKYKTILPYSPSAPITYNAQFHYHNFTLFEYLEAVDFNPSFDIASLINQCVQPSGKVFELGNEFAPERFGFGHTYWYGAYVMYRYGTLSSLQTACALVENVLSQCYPSGFHVFPLDRWKKHAETIDHAIEVQGAYQPILEVIFNS
jgi:hypothetical protein